MSSVEFTSEAVRGAKFREKLKGYHPEDVDAFLERAATALDQMSSRLAEATARAIKAETALASNSEADESVRKTLVLAQRTAEMAVNEANAEAQQIREAAEAEAKSVQAAAEAHADELRADAERVHAAAVEEAAATVADANSAAEARLREAAERIEAQESAAQAERERLAADAVRESEEAVRSLLDQQRELRAEVGALAGYLAAERARVLEVLTTAVEQFGQTLAPSRPAPISEIDEAIDRDELAKGSADPASEDSWNFDPTVLKQPENQWWSETADPPADGAWAAALGNDEPLPEWFTAAVAESPTTTAAPPADTVEATETAPAEASSPESGPGPEPEEVDVEVAEADAAPAGELDQMPSPTDEDEEPPSALLFTLEDEGRHADDDDEAYSAAAKPRKTLLGRRRD